MVLPVNTRVVAKDTYNLSGKIIGHSVIGSDLKYLVDLDTGFFIPSFETFIKVMVFDSTNVERE
jgi:hypothetical protein